MIKNFFVLVSLVCFLNELPTRAMDRHSYKRGCTNKRKCHYNGLVEKSEPYCEACELNKRPRRFVACGFCRRPLRAGAQQGVIQSTYCFTCQQNIESLLLDRLLVHNDNDGNKIPPFAVGQQRQVLVDAIRSCLLKKKGVHRDYIKEFHSITPYNDLFKISRSRMKKPVMYVGARKQENGKLLHIWMHDVHIKPEDKKLVLDAAQADEYVDAIFDTYNIIGPQTGTITDKTVTEEMVTFEDATVSSFVDF